MNAGDIAAVDVGTPIVSEAGFLRPSVIVTADAFLRFRPTAIFVVPLTSTRRWLLDNLAMITGTP